MSLSQSCNLDQARGQVWFYDYGCRGSFPLVFIIIGFIFTSKIVLTNFNFNWHFISQQVPSQAMAGISCFFFQGKISCIAPRQVELSSHAAIFTALFEAYPRFIYCCGREHNRSAVASVSVNKDFDKGCANHCIYTYFCLKSDKHPLIHQISPRILFFQCLYCIV